MTYPPSEPPPNYPPQYPAYPPPHRDSWFKRNMLWFIPLVLCIIGSPFICCGALFFGAWRMVNQPIDAAFTAVESDVRVIDRLGQPLKRGTELHFTDMEINNSVGFTDIGFGVSGPRAGAEVEGRVRLNGDQWSAEYLTVTFSDGTQLVIPEGATPPPSFVDDEEPDNDGSDDDANGEGNDDSDETTETIQEILREN